MHAAARIPRVEEDVITTTGPTVTYDAGNQTIAATVIVSLPSGAEDLVYDTPLIGIPGPGELGPRWTVFWNLQLGDGLSSVSFPESDGIVVPATGTTLPPHVTVTPSSSHMGSSSTQWQVTIENTVTGANSFNYDITAIGIPVQVSTLASFKTTTHDPTIVVTKDPIG
jgi:hypothetical protein